MVAPGWLCHIVAVPHFAISTMRSVAITAPPASGSAPVAARPAPGCQGRRPQRKWSRKTPPMKPIETLTDDEFDNDHTKSVKHEPRGCLQCLFQAHTNRWRNAACWGSLPFTWLSYKGGGLGCILCHAHGCETALGKYEGGAMMLKASSLKRHAGTFQHQSAEAFMEGEAAATEVHAPPKPDEFNETLHNVRAGKMSMMQSNPRKTRCMEWCLAEAIRTRHRAFIASASTLSMSEDQRQGRLLMYFSGACRNTLQVRQGVLGLERSFGTGNVAYQRGMQVIIERLCTPDTCHPHAIVGGRAPQSRDAAEIILDPSKLTVHDSGGAGGVLDDVLLSHVKKVAHMVVADGAGDGHIAYEELKKSGVLPNIIVASL